MALATLFVVLLAGVVLLLRHDSRRQQGSLARELVKINSQNVTRLEIIPGGVIEETFHIERQGEQWKVGTHQEQHNANTDQIERILEELSPLTPQQLISRNPEKWSEFHVSDETGTRVKIYEGNNLAGDIVIGKIHFAQHALQGGRQNPEISTHVRLTGQDETFIVSGFLSSMFQPDLSAYRDQTVVKANLNDIEKIVVSGGEGFGYELTREGDQWLINGVPADTEKTTAYLESLAHVTSNGFAEAESVGLLNFASHELSIHLTGKEPVKVQAFPTTDTVHMNFINSSQNLGSVFSGSQNELFNKLFKPASHFIAAQQE
ncbi:MAG TPA: DUF4340 domain-containing protein [Bacteroidales bacterium]|nr:DUF4340 domain-containing protein [Bacteroidales bacterium]